MEENNFSLDKLNSLYAQAESEDRAHFAEMRSNILLIAGDHYSSKGKDFTVRTKGAESSQERQKLRLTKNHIPKIVDYYVESILSQSPWVKIVPHNSTDIQDQKSAELNQSVWYDAKVRHRLKEKVREYCQSLVGIGEVHVKISWDPNKGEIIGYAQKVDEGGLPVADAMGQPVADENQPIYSGDFDIEEIFGFNLLRDPAAQNINESSYLISRKMVASSVLKKRYEGDEDKLKAIKADEREAFVVFDSNQKSYNRTKDQVLVKEYYWRPCAEYPNGYFVIATENGKLEEGELPFGIFPIISAGFDKHPTLTRCKSIVKRARPYQAEINRAASQQAQHQITIGDDKLIYQAGTKLSQGALLPGVRGITYQGLKPEILSGRDGSQYTAYIEGQIQEMYTVCEITEQFESKDQSNDSFAMLFRRIAQQKKFSKYAEKFNQFLVDFCELYLKLAKNYLDDSAVIRCAGKKEQINIPEFRSTDPLSYQINVEQMDESLETMMGRQLTITQVLQYAGKQLQPDDIGKMLKALPFANIEEAFDDFTLDYDNAKNDMLAMERGEVPQISETDDHEYMVKKLTHRMRQPDFKFLDPQIQELYAAVKDAHEQALVEQEQKIIAAKNEYIPADGPLVAVDMYVEPKNPGENPKRARLPTRAIEWLVKQLETQGMSLEKLGRMEQSTLASIAGKMQPTQGAPQNSQQAAIPEGEINGNYRNQ